MHYLKFLPLILIVLSSCSSEISISDDTTWYPFTPQNDYSRPSLIGLEDWNDEAAGEQGRIRSEGDRLVYGGQELKLWGINNTYGDCAPSRELAEKRAAFYRKFGINAMRLHKYADRPAPAGMQTKDSFLGVDEAYLDRMDYFVKVLKDNGIYTLLSPTFGVKFGPGDIARIPFHREVGEFSGNRDRIRVSYGAIYLSEELQDMQIEQTIALLNHTNPYTGLRYADDPAISCVEMFNEDAVLWYGGNWSLQRYPTLRSRTARAFSAWLLDKYGDEQSWREAWGDEAILSDVSDIRSQPVNTIITVEKIEGPPLQPESAERGTVLPWSYLWALDNVVQEGSDFPALKQRLLDAAAFLTGLQDAFYARFKDAIRATGYQGEIVASNWQAGSQVGHLLNLHSDYQVGIVDRHNYFGGKIRAFRELGEFGDESMLAQPGMGTLSAGFQQVEGRPFMLSEWIHVQPNEWYAEGPAILGAYGWGLNGWDVSYMFQNRDDGGFSERLGKHAWDVSNPAVMGIFPAVSRQVRRMDVRESEEVHHLNAHLPSLIEGRQSFSGEIVQHFDVKSFSTDKVTPATLAVKRVAVSFNEKFRDTEVADISGNLQEGDLVSSTGELRWRAAEDSISKGGYFTINTAATKAFVGFAPGGKTFDLGGGYFITPAKGFSVIYLCAKGREEKLASADTIVVTVMARVRNTGMELNEEENALMEAGEAPLVMEPVKAILKLPFRGTLKVLNQDGDAVLTERPFRKQAAIDGALDKTPFYLITK